MADRVQLQQVLMNLMLNGIEATKDTDGDLSIRSQLSEDGELLISVTDNGIGLPAERADEIFNAFFTPVPSWNRMADASGQPQTSEEAQRLALPYPSG
jgi:signal transduction histidine kinase